MFIWHPFFYSLLPLFFFLAFLLKLLSTTPTPHKNRPPAPSKLPIIGNLHKIGLFPHRSLQSLAQKYGPLMLLHFGRVPVLVISSADAAREIMKTHDLIFSNRPKSTFVSKFTYDSKDVVFAPYGEYWRQMKSICVLQLLNNKRVMSFRVVREEETALMIEKIKQSYSSASSVVNLTETFVSLTNNIVCRVALGRKYSGEGGGRKFKKLLGELGELVGIFNVGDYIPWLAWVNHLNGLNARVDKVAKEMDRFLESVVEEHMVPRAKERNGGESVDEGEGQQDFVDVLLEIQREKMAGIAIDRDGVKGIISDMFIGGTDTTSTALEWTMTEMLRHPEVLKKVQNEVRGIARGKSGITEDDIERMHYLKAVIKETMRLHPPIPLLIPRESIQDVQVLEYDIAAGTQVIINAWAIGRDPLSWEDPEVFRPERFLNTSIDFKGHDFELIPFGSGRRGCPGIVFAMNVNELALANVVQKFDLSLHGGASGDDLDITEATGLTIHKKHPLIVVATPYSC